MKSVLTNIVIVVLGVLFAVGSILNWDLFLATYERRLFKGMSRNGARVLHFFFGLALIAGGIARFFLS